MDRFVIVGGGAAGVAAAETLRRSGYVGPLTMLCGEPELPYDRPPLSKQVLTGTWDNERTRLREAGHYARLGIRLVHGQADSLDLDLGRGSVGLADGCTLRFDGLIIATGVRPRRLPAGHELAGVHVLRGHPDVAALRAAFGAARRVVIVGAGFLGLEVAAAARALGLDVTVVDPLAEPMIRQVGPLIGAAVARLHRSRGVDLRLGTGVSALLADAGGGTVTGVALTDGTTIAAGCVLVAIGAVPATDWLVTSGLAVGDGVECDQYCRAAPGVYAAGDVASWINPRYHRRMRVEHRTNATEQGAAAALNLLKGDVSPYAPVPYFWTDQYDVKIQVHGYLPDGCEAAIEEGSVDDGTFVALYRADGVLTAVLGWNAPARILAYRKLLLLSGRSRTRRSNRGSRPTALATTSTSFSCSSSAASRAASTAFRSRVSSAPSAALSASALPRSAGTLASAAACRAITALTHLPSAWPKRSNASRTCRSPYISRRARARCHSGPAATGSGTTALPSPMSLIVSARLLRHASAWLSTNS
jgi:3-phenylpropionate/trans-cinnamate dioxygenase ferredoxin reductase subunit